MCVAHVWVLAGARRGCLIYWSWTYRSLSDRDGNAGNRTPGPLEEQQLLFTAGPSLQHHKLIFSKMESIHILKYFVKLPYQAGPF